MACGVLAPQPGVEPVPPAMEAQSRKPWITRGVPAMLSYNSDHNILY